MSVEWSIKSLDPATIEVSVAKLQVRLTGLKEAFSAWNDSKFEDNTSLCLTVEYGPVHLFGGSSWVVHASRIDAVEESRGIQLRENGHVRAVEIWLACRLASFPGSPRYKEGGEPGTFYHVRDVRGRREVDTT